VRGDRARFAHLATIASDVCRTAADVVSRSRGRAVEVGRKSSPTDVVTQTDVDSELHIRARLHELMPSSTVIGEEGGATGLADDLVVWIVDPLDGTVNFTYDLPVIAVSIAAAVDGRVVAGAVADVMRGESFAASLGNGATLDGEPLSGSTCNALDAALLATGFSYSAELRRAQGPIIGTLLPVVRDVRCFGSAALQMCWVAAGRVDGYFERDTKMWDYSAAALIASEAGMSVELPCPENGGLSIAAPPALFPTLRGLVDIGSPEPG
jgi:myo-inositol-1(or 4)-monophosphatase